MLIHHQGHVAGLYGEELTAIFSNIIHLDGGTLFGRDRAGFEMAAVSCHAVEAVVLEDEIVFDVENFFGLYPGIVCKGSQ